jgi:hypothetical protein
VYTYANRSADITTLLAVNTEAVASPSIHIRLRQRLEGTSDSTDEQVALWTVLPLALDVLEASLTYMPVSPHNSTLKFL